MPRAPVEKAEFQVIVSKSVGDARAQPGRPLIAIIPDPSTWNDYGYGLFADLLVLTNGDEEDLSAFRLMIEGEQRTYPYLKARLDELGPVFGLDAINLRFCSMQSEAGGYRRFVELLGYDVAIGALRVLHDVVLANLEREDQDVLELVSTDAFHLGMIRIPERYTAYRRGGRYLRPTPAPNVPDAGNSFGVEALLPSYKNVIGVNFDFSPDPIFDDRCAVLIGRNGVGKTQLLNALAASLTEGREEGVGGDAGPEDGTAAIEPLDESEAAQFVRWGARFVSEAPRYSRVLVFSSVPSDPYPKSIAPWDGIDYEYFAVAADNRPLGRLFVQGVVDCLRSDGSAFGDEGGHAPRLDLLQSMLEQLGFLSRLYVPIRADAEDGFRDLLQIDDDLYVGFHQNFNERDKNRLAMLVDIARPSVILSETMEPRRLSSGELAMAQFAAQAVASVETGSLLLLDEPETHLHPNYISTFMDLLQELLERTKSVAIVATHSAYVLREVPRQRVNVLSRDADGIVSVDRPRLQTFGATIDELSQFVFDDWSVSPRFRRRLAAWGRETATDMGIDGIVEVYGDQLNPTMLALVARAINEGSVA